MPGVTTTGSTNIAVLDSKIVADLCGGKLYVDVTPSVYIGSTGEQNVLGANVEIINPFGVTIKPYGSNYEIAPDLSGEMDTVIQYNIPTQSGSYITGIYTVNVKLFDGANSWVVTKTVKVCASDKSNKNRNYGSIGAIMKSDCKNGKLFIVINGLPTYNGTVVESQSQEFTLLYPTASELAPLVTSFTGFSVVLFEGVYILSGEICATYNYGDNVYVKVKYKIKQEKNVRCLIDPCCVFTALNDLHLKIPKDCTDAERAETAAIALDALRLFETAQLAAECNEDPSPFIEELEELLGCKCTCNCNEGTPIIGGAPVSDITITGCNVESSQSGLTKNYTINNYSYLVEIVENGGAIVVSSPTLENCVLKQTITFNIDTVYSQIKDRANEDDTESLFWASIINKQLTGLNPTCLGLSGSVWNALSFAGKFSAIFTKICECCGCTAIISGNSDSNSGSDVTLTWDENSAVFSVDVYMDSVFKGNVLAGVGEFKLSGAADSAIHEYTLIPKCSSGSVGNRVDGEFHHWGCPELPTVDVDNVYEGVGCPFDLESVLAIDATYTLEVHNAENTNPSSLVNYNSLSGGVYYAYYKDGDGCYSVARKFTIICATATSCTAPQNLQVYRLFSFVYITFQSAAYPPPSYTVKRKLAADPDVDGSYTTLNPPTWDASSQRWVVSDGTYDDNTHYTYKAISNCGGSPASTPSVKFNFANFSCHTMTATPDVYHIDYSLNISGSGDIDKFEIKLYNADQTVLIKTDTFLPAFSNPITGTFFYLTPDTDYKIVTKAYISDLSKDSCSVLTVSTLVEL